MVSHIEFHTPKKPPAPNNIGEGLSGTQRRFWKEAIFVLYDENKHFILFSATISIKYLPEGTKVIRSLISPSIEEGDCSNAWEFVGLHCANGIS